MPDIRAQSERLWNGELDTVFEHHPVTSPYNDRRAEELLPGILYLKGTAGVTTLDTGDGLVMLDTGGRRETEIVHAAVRGWRSDARLAAAVFSHHHVDHVFGVEPFDREAEERGLPRPVVYGHEAIPEHFERYRRTSGWNNAINRRQLMPGPTVEASRDFRWGQPVRLPDVTYQRSTGFRQGDLTFELTHTRGETEDATWTWVPEHKLLATGDLFIWAVPNAGNPQKVQRWIGEWAVGLRQMAALGAELLVPGHGLPIFGADRVHLALEDTAAFLESIESQVLELMNTGASLDTILHEVKIPEATLAKPYLRPVYDHPQFLIRNVWRLYGGWYDGEPDRLLPSRRREEAREWIALAGGVETVIDRAEALLRAGNARLASHLIENAVSAEPDSERAHAVRAAIYDSRASGQTSQMARNIFRFAAASSRIGKRDDLWD
jgi:alkyl sulfatase BDS1-like metallo-beta-lactamase superfamily hydrolase